MKVEQKAEINRWAIRSMAIILEDHDEKIEDHAEQIRVLKTEIKKTKKVKK